MSLRSYGIASGAGVIFMYVLQFALSILQLFAIISGIETFGIHWVFGIIIWFFLIPVPVIPTILGFIGAIKGWGWEWWQAGLLFFGLQIAIFALTALGIAAFSILKLRKKYD